jgi:hypothetical protein
MTGMKTLLLLLALTGSLFAQGRVYHRGTIAPGRVYSSRPYTTYRVAPYRVYRSSVVYATPVYQPVYVGGYGYGYSPYGYGLGPVGAIGVTAAGTAIGTVVGGQINRVINDRAVKNDPVARADRDNELLRLENERLRLENENIRLQQQNEAARRERDQAAAQQQDQPQGGWRRVAPVN